MSLTQCVCVAVCTDLKQEECLDLVGTLCLDEPWVSIRRPGGSGKGLCRKVLVCKDQKMR